MVHDRQTVGCAGQEPRPAARKRTGQRGATSGVLIPPGAHARVAAAAARLASGARSLPAVEASGVALQAAIRIASAGGLELVDRVAADRRLASTVVWAANEPPTGAVPIITVRGACQSLGDDEVSTFVLAYALRDLFIRRRRPWARIGADMLRVAVVTANGSRGLVALLPRTGIEPRQAQLAGLLHNIGQAVALHLLASSLPDVSASDVDRLRHDVARCIAPHHEAIGAATLDRWRARGHLPPVCLAPDGSVQAEMEQLREVVRLARSLAARLGHAHGPGADPGDVGELCRSLRVPEDQAARVFLRAAIWARLRR